MQESAALRTGKNVVVCCDGTGNEFIDWPDPENSNSNVVKLYTTLIVDNEQVVYYHPGVGTAGDPRTRTRLGKAWSKTKGLAFAAGFKDNVLDAYRYLMETYDDGDRVYLIGFSRGAYTVRALAGLLYGYGLLCRGNEGHLPYAWNSYVKQHSWRKRKRLHVHANESFKVTFSRPGFEVYFMGIWDTVSSVGWIYTPLRLYSVAKNPIIRTGRHAISVDERRCFYRDNLWDGADKSELTKDEPSVVNPEQDLLQLWFAGVHSDIGGSYAQIESGLSNKTLRWMLGQAEIAGLRLKPEMVKLVLGCNVNLTGDPVADKKIKELLPLYPPAKDKLHHSLRWLWWLLELLPHRYYDKDQGAEQWRIPFGMRRRISSGSYLHCSAKERLDAKTDGYAPSNVLSPELSLHEVEVKGQTSGSVYLYTPGSNPQPWLNRALARWLVILVVCAVELAVTLWLLCHIARWAWYGLRWTGHAVYRVGHLAWWFCHFLERHGPHLPWHRVG